MMMFLMWVPTGLFGVWLFAMSLLAADLAEQLHHLASSDPLTGILNRRGFEEAASALLARCGRAGQPAAAVIVDIDRFKAVNDRFGHGAGDTVLRRFADHIAANKREDDLFGRLGCEEFVLILSETDGQEALRVMERIRGGLAAALLDLVPSTRITASFGVAERIGDADSFGDMLGRADRALYRSKMEGRDRITLAAARDHQAAGSLPPARARVSCPAEAAGHVIRPPALVRAGRADGRLSTP